MTNIINVERPSVKALAAGNCVLAITDDGVEMESRYRIVHKYISSALRVSQTEIEIQNNDFGLKFFSNGTFNLHMKNNRGGKEIIDGTMTDNLKKCLFVEMNSGVPTRMLSSLVNCIRAPEFVITKDVRGYDGKWYYKSFLVDKAKVLHSTTCRIEPHKEATLKRDFKLAALGQTIQKETGILYNSQLLRKVL